jgi:choline dehydrogenase-like flavoprotein
MALREVDVVVIGAGAGGGIAAKELATSGLRVVLLERGRWYTAADCRKDDLRNQRTTALGNGTGPDDDGHPRVLVEPGGAQRIILPSQPGYSNNAACVGGGTLTYGAMAWRFHPLDFRMRSHYGAPPGSTLDDWPISYDDLEPFYEKAEWEIGVSGDDTGNPFKGPRRRPLPMKPVGRSREYDLLEPAARRLNLHPFDIPMLRNSTPYNGRAACMRCRWCVGFVCEVDAKNGTQNTAIPTALQTGLCELRTHATASRIVLDDHGQARGVEYFDSSRRRQFQPAKAVVVAACAIETARLLLLSKHRLHPNGLGNRYDWVGRNLQGHTYSGAIGYFRQQVYDDLGPGAGIAICDYNHGNPGLVGGAMLCNEFIRLPVQFLNFLPPGIPRWGKPHKDAMRRYYTHTIAVQGPTQEIPVFDARVELDPVVKDKFGLPVARLSGGKHPHTLEIATAMCEKAAAWLKEAGAEQTWPKLPGRGLSGGQHQAGTCRMGNDPKTSVVNRYGQLHEVPNVWIMDGSVHVTNGGFNPVLTIMAIAYWSSAHLLRLWKGTGLRG